jgi:hypothetical protein
VLLVRRFALPDRLERRQARQLARSAQSYL